MLSSGAGSLGRVAARWGASGSASSASLVLPKAAPWNGALARHVPRMIKSTTVSASAAGAAAPTAGARMVGWWLTGTAGAVAAMICVGGYTRLTRSGLSMVDWRPQGRALPSSDEEWEAEFEKYKAFPEFQMVNRHISMQEFQDIYFVEWFHRMWGRGLGLLFCLPAAVFAARGMIPAGVGGKVAPAGLLGATQGGVGWWMVKSGLTTRDPDDHSIPRVSPYRLATHLGFAFTTYSVLVWAAMDCFKPGPSPVPAGAAATAVKAALRSVKPLAVGAAALAGVTAASGAFVAGNDAGRAFNDWPLMAGRVVPEGIWEEGLGVRNFFENTATVQFDHRMLAYSTLTAAGLLTAAARRGPTWAALPSRVRHGVMAFAGSVAAQATLGITTLMMYVPVGLGTAHQAGAVVAWTAALSLLHSLKGGAAAKVAAAASPAVRVAMAAPVLGVAAVAGGLVKPPVQGGADEE